MVAKTRQKQRTNTIAQSEHLLSSTAIEAKPSTDLFVLDTAGNEELYRRKRRELNAGEKTKKDRAEALSKFDKDKIERILKSHDAKEVIKLAEERKKRKHQRKKKTKTKFDVWEETDLSNKKTKVITSATGTKAPAGTSPVVILTPKDRTATTTKKARKETTNRKEVAVDVALPGQSYRPDDAHHKETIDEAVDIEMKRNKAIEYHKTPISNGMSQQTLELLVGSDDEEEEEEEPMQIALPKKKSEKLTRAQLNKRKRVIQEQVAIKERKKTKKFLNEINEAKKLNKEISAEEKLRDEEKAQLVSLKEEQQSSNPVGANVLQKAAAKNPMHVSYLPVALPSELEKTSLRVIKPKGSVLMDRIESMAERKMINKKRLEKRKNRKCTITVKSGFFIRLLTVSFKQNVTKPSFTQKWKL